RDRGDNARQATVTDLGHGKPDGAEPASGMEQVPERFETEQTMVEDDQEAGKRPPKGNTRVRVRKPKRREFFFRTYVLSHEDEEIPRRLRRNSSCRTERSFDHPMVHPVFEHH